MLKQQQQQQQVFFDENMSNLTSAASGEASTVSSTTHDQPSAKRKRSLPGNPDPDAEVIAMSPKSLLTKNRFLCEICNKGFQRDQNLQLHRRGHNLPWKLKQRSSKEVRKKVYVCPESSCVHHDPSRALGDLTGIKKHFSRKHGEKKWKCEKCSKKYAVQSDWKAHSKICGTREYRCDCGTLFSRRDSYITHRAFCDALAEETLRGTPTNSNPNQQPQINFSSSNNSNNNSMFSFQVKREQPYPYEVDYQNMLNLPPWVDDHHQNLSEASSSLSILDHHHHHQQQHQIVMSPGAPYPMMSATALLQRAAQIGVTMTKYGENQQQGHVPDTNSNTTATAGLNLSSRDHHNMTTCPSTSSSSLFHEMMMMNSISSSSSYEPHDDGFGSLEAFHRTVGGRNFGPGNGIGGGNDGLTRDFLGLSQNDMLTLAGLGNCINKNTSPEDHNKLWQG